MSTMERRRVSARRESLLGDEPGAFAVARFVRVTAQKSRRVGDLIRGESVDNALATLQFAPQAVAEVFYKLVDSAAANAESTEGLDRSSLVITTVHVDEGPTMKRWRPRAKGSANRIFKRTSHLTVVVTPVDEAPKQAPKAKAAENNPPRPKAAGGTPTQAKKTTAKKAAAKKPAAKTTEKEA